MTLLLLPGEQPTHFHIYKCLSSKVGLELSTHQAQLYKSPTQVNSKLNQDKLEHVDEAQLVFELSLRILILVYEA